MSYYPRTDVENDTVTLWSIGSNMPGYMPEADVNYASSWEDAKAIMLGDLRYTLEVVTDQLAGVDVEPDADDYAENLTSAMNDLEMENGPTWGTTVDDSPSGTAYWIEQVVMSVADATEAGIEL